LTKLEHEIIYRTVIGNKDTSITDIIITCTPWGTAQSVRWSIDKLIDMDIIRYDNGVINTIKPPEYHFYRNVVNNTNLLTCAEIDKIIRSLTTGRNPTRRKLRMIAKIGTMMDMTVSEMRAGLMKQEFKMRFIKAAMRIIKRELKEEYENRQSNE